MPQSVVFPIFLNAALPPLLITEIMYNNPGDDDYEYIEMYNAGGSIVALEGFYFSGITHQFRLPEFIQPGHYLLLAKNSILCHQEFGKTFREWESGSLSNSGECIELLNQLGEVITRVCYDNTGGWPKEPNGAGAALELRSISSANNEVHNWRSAFEISGRCNNETTFGSPGTGFENNKVSFKSDQFSFTEGTNSIRIPLVVKMLQGGPVWIKVSASSSSSAMEGVDFNISTRVLRITSGSGNFIDLELLDDNQFEDLETITLGIEELCNGELSGFTSTAIEVIDNDHFSPALCVSEWMPQNSRTVLDEFGEYDPWLELYNPNDFAVTLDNFSITATDENTDSTSSHILGAQLIQPKGFLILYADSQPGQGPNHVNLILPKKHGKIELFGTNGSILITSRKYETSYSNKSQGAIDFCGDSIMTFSSPSPGTIAGNSTSITSQSSPDFTIYPNPVSAGTIYLPVLANYTIYSVHGKELMKVLNVNKINVQNLPSGVYFLTMEEAGTRKFIIP